jgi:hypothetical protein
VALLLASLPAAGAAAKDMLAGSWQGPHAPLVAQVLRGEDVALSPAAGGERAAWTYAPQGESGVPAKLAQSLGGEDAKQREASAKMFAQLRDAWAGDARKRQRDADLAAAMATFVAVSTAATQRAPLMPDEDADRLHIVLARAIAASPELRELPDAKKQYMRDWFATMGGFIALSHQAAGGDASRLQRLDTLVDEAVRVSLGLAAKQLQPQRASRLASGTATATGVDAIAGTWQAATDARDGSSFKLAYRFLPDGRYGFKSEHFGGKATNEFNTVEETGNWSVAGTTLSLRPEENFLTVRDGQGKVLRRTINAVEPVDYSFRTQRFESIGQAQLVLKPPHPTLRDGALPADAEFPGAYVLSSGTPTWRW